ncbi:hypothetical protein A3D85_00700 [Candidatus Amesbacteria bacterium RIFCSPHIGHO2_02_FULL_47_9]|nr:MAG: hypothetical protein A3D85_00700 [Candidatus Amesbacteria bacterium RIFCSPHIGHO2_02_FULL_47_9]OGD06952.1 MAG: hypothetical protein A2899_03570 [Candidatus Amesbacteria bacterium RIFCSPLOWO2_01_FULL_49_25]
MAKNYAHLARKLNAVRKGKHVVFLSGTFDLLHTGHLIFFDFAKRQGDILVVGIATDQNIKFYKGPKRPVIPEKLRARLAAGLAMVDHVVLLDEEITEELDVQKILSAIRPNKVVLLQKDPLLRSHQKLGEKLGFKVVTQARRKPLNVDFPISTSWIIEQIKKRY